MALLIDQVDFGRRPIQNNLSNQSIHMAACESHMTTCGPHMKVLQIKHCNVRRQFIFKEIRPHMDDIAPAQQHLGSLVGIHG